jgi:outer membrane lipoprotein-sorting protein
MTFLTRWSLIVLVAVLLLTAGTRAQEAAAPADPNAAPKVDEIVHRSNFVSYYQGADGRADVKMTIHDGRGNTRNREFTILRWDAPRPVKEGQDEPNKREDDYTGNQKFYVYFERPADVNKMVFLVHKYLGRDDDRWLYQPALDLVRRISAADKRTRFVGSHFYYEDVSGRNVDEDTHELVQTTKDYYVLRNRPKDPKNVEFAYYDMYILKSNFLPVYVYYYDGQDRRYRQYEVVSWDKNQPFGYPTVTKARMRDLRSDGHTDLEYREIKYNVGLPESIFTERYLRRPPRKHLR